MATGSTPVRGRPYPLETDAPDVAADMHTLALNLDQVGNITSGTTLPVTGMVAGDEFRLTTTGAWYKYSGSSWQPFGGFGRDALVPISQSTSTTMVAGNRYYSNAPTTQTLPAPSDGLVVGVVASIAATGANPVTVAYGSGGGAIFGPGLSTSGVSSFVLGTPLSSVTLVALGGAWIIFQGQPDTGWMSVTPAGGTVVEACAWRLAGDLMYLAGSFLVGSSPAFTFAHHPTQTKYYSYGSNTFNIDTSGNLTASGGTAVSLDQIIYSVV